MWSQRIASRLAWLRILVASTSMRLPLRLHRRREYALQRVARVNLRNTRLLLHRRRVIECAQHSKVAFRGSSLRSSLPQRQTVSAPSALQVRGKHFPTNLSANSGNGAALAKEWCNLAQVLQMLSVIAAMPTRIRGSSSTAMLFVRRNRFADKGN